MKIDIILIVLNKCTNVNYKIMKLVNISYIYKN
jgi:hypothetical protein